SPTAAVVVSGDGVDPDADARRVIVRVFDAVGVELAREEQRLSPSGPQFELSASLRGTTLAAAREVVVEAADATGRSSVPARAALACPADGSLGDSFCALGDLLARLPGFPARARIRLARDAQAAARALVRAGGTTSASVARRFLRRVEKRLARFARRARAVRADPG